METSVDLRSIFIANKLNQFEYFIETNKIHSELRASVPTRSEVSPFNASSFPVLHILEYIRLWQRRRSTSRGFFAQTRTPAPSRSSWGISSQLSALIQTI